MDFINKIKRTRGLTCFYNKAICEVLSYYEDQNRVMIRITKGESYVVNHNGICLEYVSDGSDTIVVDVETLRPMR